MDVSFEGNTSTGKDEWLTPPYVIEALGSFDLDPCSPIKRPWPTAKEHYTILDKLIELDEQQSEKKDNIYEQHVAI